MDWKKIGKAGLGAAEVGLGIASGNPALAMQGGKQLRGSMRKPPTQVNSDIKTGSMSSRPLGPPIPAPPNSGNDMLTQASYDRKSRISQRYPGLT